MMNVELGKEYDLNFVEWDTTLKFNLTEACGLMCREIIRSEDVALLPKPPTIKVGTIVGVIAMNDEIEVIVRFLDDIDQLTKTEFCGDYKLIPE